MAKQQKQQQQQQTTEIATQVKPTPGRPFRHDVNSIDARINAIEADLREMRANLQAVTLIVDKMSRS